MGVVLAPGLHATPASLPQAPTPYITEGLLTGDGTVWIATEGKGIYRCTDGGTWEPMHLQPGYPDTLNAYALAEDASGNIWAGTDNRGIAVWNGQSWKTYSREDGIPGERIYDIATWKNRVAVATSGGIALYKDNKWTFFTRAEGLADDAAAALAFDGEANLLAAYNCGGIGTSTSANGYASWKNTQAPWHYDNRNRVRQPYDAAGTGLPSNLGNAIAAGGQDRIWYGSTAGVATSGNAGATWNYLRGRDYEAKNKGLYDTKLPAAIRQAAPGDLLLEDHVTALYPCEQGLWIGYRQAGAQLVDPATLAPMQETAELNKQKDPRAKWVTGFLRLPSGILYATTYGGGLQRVAQLPALPGSKAPAAKTPRTHPFAPTIPREEEIARLQKNASSGQPSEEPAFYWHEDWLTRGNWFERYGRSVAMLCAAASPENVFIDLEAQDEPPSIGGMIGPHRQKGDHLRLWLHDGHLPGNPNVLRNPEAGTRTEAEWDDHGEEYPMSHDGPDVWVKTTIPEGPHLLSLYFYNPNGHVKRSGYRDYLVELRTGDTHTQEKDLASLQSFNPVLARTRIRDFSGSGCYKNFYVTGPATYLVRVCRNNSFNTILNGVFISPIRESRLIIKRPPTLIGKLATSQSPAPLSDWDYRGLQPGDLPAAPLALWSRATHPELLPDKDRLRSRLDALTAYRYMQGCGLAPSGYLDYCRWQLGLWTPATEKAYDAAMDKAWEGVQELYVHARSAAWRPFSPGVVPLSIEELEYLDLHRIDWKQYRKGYKGTPNPDLATLRQRIAERKELARKEEARLRAEEEAWKQEQERLEKERKEHPERFQNEDESESPFDPEPSGKAPQPTGTQTLPDEDDDEIFGI
ncbi:hypothetical protein AC781_08540 [Akkermansia glycaniphila]|nr:hypothetical protein AC781_08540 [Akkermansia glycaniphila]